MITSAGFVRKRSLNCTFIRLEVDNKADSVLVNAYEINIGQVLKRMGYFRLNGPAHIIRILSFFGLLTYKLKSLLPKEQYSKEYIKLKSIRITPFGSVFFDLLDKKRPFTLWNMPFRYFTYADNPGQDFENEQAKQEIFAEPFKRILNTETVIDKGLPILKSDNLKGTFTFKVSINLAIQEVYSFENDHLYSFSLDPQRLHPQFLKSTYLYWSLTKAQGQISPIHSKVLFGKVNHFYLTTG